MQYVVSDFTMCVRLVVTTGDDDDHSSNNISFGQFHTITAPNVISKKYWNFMISVIV